MVPGNDKHRLLINHLPDAFAYHQIITDKNGTPVDYVFLDVNPAYEEMTGLTRDKLMGKKVTEVLPGIERSGFDWIGTYGKVALTGESIRFEQYSEPLECWYEVTAYSNGPGYFATLFRDISARKQEKASLESLARLAEKYLQFPLGELDYQVITDDLLALSGAKYAGFNTFTEDGKKSITRALSGIAPTLRHAADLLGFELIGKEWPISPVRLDRLRGGQLTRFDDLYDTACGTISRQTASLLQKMFALGEVYVMGMDYGGRLMGDMIFIMAKGEKLQNPQIIELYSRQAALALVRTQAELLLQESEQRLSCAQTFTHAGAWDYNIKKATLFWSKECEAVFGLDEGEFAGTFADFLKRVYPEDLEFVISMNQPITDHQEGIPFEYEHRIVKKDGAVHWVRESAGVIKDEAGNPVRIIGFVMDTTEQKQAEEALKEREEQLNLFFSQSMDGFFFMMLDEPVVWDETTDKEKTLEYVMHHQRMTRVNQAMLDQYRGKAEDFIGLTTYDLFKHDLEHGRQIWRGLFDQGRWHVETNERRLDGTQMWVDGDYICMYDSQGRIVGHFGVQNDITDRKQAEQTLNHQLKFEQVIAKISSAFVNLTAEKIDEGINYT